MEFASPSLGILGGLLRTEEVREEWWDSWVSQRAKELLLTVIHSVFTEFSLQFQRRLSHFVDFFWKGEIF